MALVQKPSRPWRITDLDIPQRERRAVLALVYKKWIEERDNKVTTEELAKRIVELKLHKPFKPKGIGWLVRWIVEKQEKENLVPPLVSLEKTWPNYRWTFNLQDYEGVLRDFYNSDGNPLPKAHEEDRVTQLLNELWAEVAELKKELEETQDENRTLREQIKTERECSHVDLAEVTRTPFLTGNEISNAYRMSQVYIVLHCYENSVRRLVEAVLSEELGVNWWDKAASTTMKNLVEGRKKKEEERRWLSPRGGTSPIYYLVWGDLEKLIRKYEHLFLPYIAELRFVESRFGDLEGLRNIVAHHGVLPSDDDFERVKLSFRDWCRQVGKSQIDSGRAAA
jgi:hypothetical protein